MMIVGYKLPLILPLQLPLLLPLQLPLLLPLPLPLPLLLQLPLLLPLLLPLPQYRIKGVILFGLFRQIMLPRESVCDGIHVQKHFTDRLNFI